MQGKSVLIVEDYAASRRALSLFFRAKGWEVREAGSVEQAITMLHPPADFALIDLTLPDGAGEDVIRAIVGSGASTRICIHTSAGDPARFESLRGLGVETIYAKAVKVNDLFDDWCRPPDPARGMPFVRYRLRGD